MLILRVVHAFRMVYMSSLGYVLEPPLFTVTSLDNTYVRVIPFFKLEWPWVTLKRGCVSIAHNTFQLIWCYLFGFKI